jgi:hypothetical protein
MPSHPPKGEMNGYDEERTPVGRSTSGAGVFYFQRKEVMYIRGVCTITTGFPGIF